MAGKSLINHLMYADDLGALPSTVLVCFSCSGFAHVMVFSMIMNSKKSAIIVISTQEDRKQMFASLW